MILSTNAFNWAALRSGMGTGDFIASLSPEREAELFKAYNEWRRSRGLPEEKAPAPTPPSAAPEQRKESAPVDDLSALITEIAAEVEEEEAENAALIQDALDGADEIVEENAPVPVEVEEEIVADESEPVPEEEIETEVPLPEAEDAAEPMSDAPEAASTQAVADDATATPEMAADAVAPTPAAADDAAEAEPAPQSVDFATIIRSLPKEPDPVLYSRIKDQYGEETKSMAQAALKEATKKHRGTAAIRAFLGWLNDV